MIMTNYYKRSGFSMIELLISLLVATIIIMGVYRFLTGSHRSYTFTKANDNVNRSMMISNRTMSNYMKLAGFRNYRRVIDDITFKRETVRFGDIDVVFPVNTFIMGRNTELVPPAVLAVPNDILYIRYFGSSVDDDLSEIVNVPSNVARDTPNNRMYDCQGNYLNRMQEAFLRFSVDAANGLTCRQVIRTFDEDGGFDDQMSDLVSLNPNVISILFGFRIDGDSRFYLSEEVTTAENKSGVKPMSKNNYELVNALRYGILVRQDTHQKMTTSVSEQTFHMLGFEDNDDVATIESNDSDIYQLVSGILFMRNRYINNE